MKKIIIGITGASGSIYAIRLIQELLKKDIFVHIVCTDNGKKVMKFETNVNIDEWVRILKETYNHVKLEDINDLFSGVASGSYKFDAMVVVPCSMGTLAEISNGLAKNLLCRAADVALKENRKLILVPRETPLNAIHLENMLKLSKLGVSILPAMPGFYHKPESMEDLINFVVGKILDSLSIENILFKKWEDQND
ncbi:UbiX family flavin prenyltransferase [Clostridium omnivorum]|uniref:Flavin prenyltransferase UbiX n=1 Tax=Clostridium omnivorum TaxID=1604902 RepID=A0ABQ5NBX5_9CLOT|nr:flavin prenyltransferase UbiX [Clostridium sp. E14]GLC32545.1 aromatic acid decarboxylase [Clostridium sp. E14]